MHRILLFLFVLFIPADSHAQTEAFEVGPDRFNELPGGKEADGIQGDFILRNDLIEAVISSNAPNRRANMSVDWDAVTQGLVYDFTLRGEDNDQLTLFAPTGQRGPVSWVRVLDDAPAGTAAIETVITAANNGGLYERHVYETRNGLPGLLISSTFRNDATAPLEVKTRDRLERVPGQYAVRGVAVGDAMNPADKASFAYSWTSGEGIRQPTDLLTLVPHESATLARYLTVGRSPAEAFGNVIANRGAETGRLTGSITGSDGEPITSAVIDMAIDGTTLPAYPDDDGRFDFAFPAGSYSLTIRDIGRPSSRKAVVIEAGRTATLEAALPPASRIAFDIRDEGGKSIPCKAQFNGINGTPSPSLGPAIRAHGYADQYQSEKGTFTVQIPPGSYNVIVTRGIEHSHIAKEVRLATGELFQYSGTLRRLVDTTGWVSADFHNHSTISGDNYCGTNDRVINLAAEHIEFAPTTEHNRIYSWQPHIDALGLAEEICTIAGIELTGSGAHLNSFPFHPHPQKQDGGAPQWQEDPRINAIVLRDLQGPEPDRWVQLNHPDMARNFVDRDADGLADGGHAGLEHLIDGAETWGLGILEKAPIFVSRNADGKESVHTRREIIWLQLLNKGHRYSCVAVSDAHAVHGNSVGGWRTYVTSSSDNPAGIDWREILRNSKAGQLVVTTGPFLEVRAEDGTLPGGTTAAANNITLQVKVQCTDWIDIDRVQVLVNGRQPEELNFTREGHPDYFDEGVVKFNRSIEVPLTEDSHLIAVAYGRNFNLKTGYGSSEQSNWRPCAYNNPIYVDVDGNGFTPNGDTLGFPLPVKNLPVEKAKELLGIN